MLAWINLNALFTCMTTGLVVCPTLTTTMSSKNTALSKVMCFKFLRNEMFDFVYLGFGFFSPNPYAARHMF